MYHNDKNIFKEVFFLIDAHSYIYKSFYVINYLCYGREINYRKSLYIFFNMIYSRYIYLNPNFIFFVFDSKCNFRKKIYTYYKSNRKKISVHLLQYIKIIKCFLKRIGIDIIYLKGFEADDIIGSLIFKIKNHFKKTVIYIISYDKDFTQLVNNDIFLIANKNNIINIIDVKKIYGVYPYLIKDFFALKGDRSDNIPGIKGLNTKDILIILNNLGNIFYIYKNLNNLKYLNIKNSTNIYLTLKENKNFVFLWYTLINIRTDLDIPIKINQYKINTLLFKKINLYLKYFKY